MKKQTAKTILLVASLFFYAIGAYCVYEGFDKKDNYYNSDYISSLNVNAYVGGDAYNYIINGTYFAGYCALGGAMFVCGSISAALGLGTDSDEAAEINTTLKTVFAKELAEAEAARQKAEADAKAEADQIQAEEDAKANRIKAYWAKRPDEYAKLLKKKNAAEELLKKPKDLTAEQLEKTKSILNMIKDELEKDRKDI